MWPFEAMPKALQYISYVFPFAIPTIAFRGILVKNLTICDPVVYLAFLTLSVWIIVSLSLCFWLLREKTKS